MTAEQQRPGVDIVIPVYRNLALTRRCVSSVLAHTDCEQSAGGRSESGKPDNGKARVIVVDDAAPEPELAAWCREQADQGNIMLLRNEDNRGFVASVNRGMAQSEDRDVVLLNSDTEVPPGWLQRLQDCALGADDIATVTPFSNNGSICSYPHFCEAAALPAGMDLASLDALFAAANPGESTEIPTAVGFCMYIRRDCLNRYGLFDEAHYGRGYGEENDFSRRVAAEGWRNCLCADLLVYHHGGASFGEESSALMQAAEKKLADRYADYGAGVMDFIARDPLALYRDRVNRRRLKVAGQGPVLLEEWQHERDSLKKRLADQQAQLAQYADSQRDYERLLEEARSAYRQTDERLNSLRAEYESILEKERQAFAETDRSLAETRERLSDTNRQLEENRRQLAVVRQELERLNNLRIIRLGRWIKRNLLRQ